MILIMYMSEQGTIHQWNSWFAWRPVTTLSGKRIWLKSIYRRANYKTYVTMDDWQRWEYGDVFDVLRAPPWPQHQR